MQEKSNSHLVVVNHEITDEEIDDIMADALDSGISYWCCRAEVVGDYLGEYASDQISRGGELILYDAESDDKWTLDRDKFLNGYKLSIEQGYFAGDICDTDYDSGTADIIVQLALFGEVVFG